MRLVIVESPYSGDVERNEEYARECVRDSLSRGESPFASHLLYTQRGILDDSKPEERSKGIWCGFEWLAKADASVVYIDLGISRGMAEGICMAAQLGKPIEFRMIRGNH